MPILRDGFRAAGHGIPLLAILFFASCCGHTTKPQPGCWGPTLPMADLVQRINENSSAIPTLYARQEIQADLYDKSRNKSFYVNSSGDIFLRKPRELLLRGRHDLAGKIFEIGSTQEVFWFTVYGDEDTRYWGHYRNIGKPCMEEMPVRPDLIGEVLGISDIPTNFLDAPFPTMRFNHDQCAYMITWNARLPNRFYAQKEIWYDGKSYLPLKVILYDVNGRVLVRANLTNHRAVEVANLPQEKWPRIATSYSLLFPESKSTMVLKLSDLALVSKNGHPKAGTIVFKDDSDVSKVIQVDEACEK
ncbi:MAG TPA: hypothetical protein VGQ99_23420 [Tepidisphaeraceae bacterium]|jgi:hypothetical protein|nr:hypothetical protein [Tepidisphaeraceae bacterium]